MTETVAPGTTRHICPLGCGWQCDQPPPSLADLAGIAPDPSAIDVREALDSVMQKAGRRRVDALESAFREHVAVTHGIHTVDELQAAIDAAQPIKKGH